MIDLFSNELFQVVLLSFIIAQSIKVISYSIRRKELYLRGFLEAGGLPSGHSAIVASLTAMIYFTEGLSNLFFASLFFSLLIMYDAMGVRREVAKHAKILMDICKTKKKGACPMLKEYVGHTTLEVILGACVGLIIAVLFTL